MPRSFNDDVRDFLLAVLGLGDAASRGTLLAGFPQSLVSAVARHPSPLVDLQEIVSRVAEWGRLASGEQSVEVLLENVRPRVRGAGPERQLDVLRRRFREALERRLSERLRVASDRSQATEARHEAAKYLADNIDCGVSSGVSEDIKRAYASLRDEPVPRYWLALAFGWTGQPGAAEFLTASASEAVGTEEHPLVREGIRCALKTIRDISREETSDE